MNSAYYSIPVFPLLLQIIPHISPIIPMNFTYYTTKDLEEHSIMQVGEVGGVQR